MAYAATIRTDGDFNVLFRFILTPLFLFSGVFFPITRLPEALQVVAWLTPLFHGVELARGLALGTLEPASGLAHVAYLVALTAAGVMAARHTFRRRLHP
jgi:lipooligosaccharide transport system permease protein